VTEASFLETTAEISVTFAGFVGVFLVLARRDGEFSRGDAFLIQVLILCCVPPLFYAVLPLVVKGFTASTSDAWVHSSRISSLAIAGFSIHNFRTQRSIPSDARAWFSSVGTGLGYALTTLAFAAHATVALGLAGAMAGALYVAGVWLILLIGGIVFTFLVLRRLL